MGDLVVLFGSQEGSTAEQCIHILLGKELERSMFRGMRKSSESSE